MRLTIKIPLHASRFLKSRNEKELSGKLRNKPPVSETGRSAVQVIKHTSQSSPLKMILSQSVYILRKCCVSYKFMNKL